TNEKTLPGTIDRKAERKSRRTIVFRAGIAALILSASAATVVRAQDSAFLACGQLSDRGQRIACLEDALEAASPQDATTSASPAMPQATVVAPAAPAMTPPAARAPSSEEPEPATGPVMTGSGPSDPSLLERLRNFGRGKNA